MNPQNRQRLLAIIAGIGLTIFAGERLVVAPLIASWKDRAKRLSELRQRVTQGETLVERDTAIRRRWSDMRAHSFATDPSRAESQLLEAFDRWSRESGVSISAILPQRSFGAVDSRVMEYRADASGNLSSLTRFLYLIESDSLGVKIDALELSARDKQGDQLHLVLQVSAVMLAPNGS